MHNSALLDTTDIEPPLKIGATDEIDWDDEADAVIVGFGGAGAAAALEAAERGRSVIVIDRFDGGGATAYSGGVYYACDTPIQKEAGFTDSPDEMYKYLAAENAPVQEDTLRRFCDNSTTNFDWVSRHVPYSSAAYTGKATYPPEGKFLYYCGNEKVPKFAAIAKPAPRGHRAVGGGYTGHVFYAGLSKAVLEAGARVISHAPARRLVIDGSGSVVGVEIQKIDADAIEKHQKLYKIVNPHMPFGGKKYEEAITQLRILERERGIRRRIRAKGGVVLATGGFVYNLDLLRQHRPEIGSAYAEIMRLGSPGCDGSGMALGETAGGNIELMRNAFVGKTISPPEAYNYGILVNRDGERFINEDAYVAVVGDAITRQPGEDAWLICDRMTYWQAIWQALTIGRSMFLFWGMPALLNAFMGGTKKGRTIEKLAHNCGIDPDGLRDSVESYNADALNGKADTLTKLPENIRPIGKGPYYALNLSIHNKYSMTPVFTLGGLRVEETSGRVLNAEDQPVSGLYTAGRTAIGLCSAGYMSGMSLADLVFSGRRAGYDIAQRTNARDRLGA